MSSLGRYAQEDGWASDGRRGLANWLRMLLKALEAQGRGFVHGHAKYMGHPNGKEELQRLLAAIQASLESGATQLADVEILERLQQINQKIIAAASTMQYECSTLPGHQLQVELPPEPFSAKQQRQSKLDGGVELDGSTQRAFLAVTPAEPWGHIAEERRRASAEHREPRHPYKELPLTKCQLSMYPRYRWPQSFGKTYSLTDEGYLDSDASQFASNPALAGEEAFVCSGATQPADSSTAASASLSSTTDDAVKLLLQAMVLLPWDVDGDGKVIGFKKWDGFESRRATWDDIVEDARMWGDAFARDVRCLHNGNHDHNCSATCVKYQKKKKQRGASQHVAGLEGTSLQVLLLRYHCASHHRGSCGNCKALSTPWQSPREYTFCASNQHAQRVWISCSRAQNAFSISFARCWPFLFTM